MTLARKKVTLFNLKSGQLLRGEIIPLSLAKPGSLYDLPFIKESLFC
jgi:hypothetical protein